MLTSRRVRELLYYEKESGLFFWRESRTGPARRLIVAGSITNGRYQHYRIRIDGISYRAEELVSLYYDGHEQPP